MNVGEVVNKDEDYVGNCGENKERVGENYPIVWRLNGNGDMRGDIPSTERLICNS